MKRTILFLAIFLMIAGVASAQSSTQGGGLSTKAILALEQCFDEFQNFVCGAAAGTVTTVGGTTNTVAKFTGANSIGDSGITDDGTDIMAFYAVGGELALADDPNYDAYIWLTSDGTSSSIDIDTAGKVRINSGDAAASNAAFDVTAQARAGETGWAAGLMNFNGTLPTVDGDDSQYGLNINWATTAATGTNNYRYAVSVDTVIPRANVVQTAYQARDGWDNFLSVDEGIDEAFFEVPTLTSDQTYTFPDATGTVMLGSGLTTNYLTKWDGTALADSLSWDDGTVWHAGPAHASAGVIQARVAPSIGLGHGTIYPGAVQEKNTYVLRLLHGDSMEALDGDDFHTWIWIDASNPASTGTGNSLHAIAINDVTNQANTVESAIKLETGWQNFMEIDENLDTAFFTVPTLTADRTYTFPDGTGTVAVVTSTPTAHLKQGTVTGVLEDSELTEDVVPAAASGGNVFQIAPTLNTPGVGNTTTLFDFSPTLTALTDGTTNYINMDFPAADDSSERVYGIRFNQTSGDYGRIRHLFSNSNSYSLTLAANRGIQFHIDDDATTDSWNLNFDQYMSFGNVHVPIMSGTQVRSLIQMQVNQPDHTGGTWQWLYLDSFQAPDPDANIWGIYFGRFMDAGLAFEGDTGDGWETIVHVVDPTADNVINFPDASGTVALTADVFSFPLTGNTTIANDSVETYWGTGGSADFVMQFDGTDMLLANGTNGSLVRFQDEVGNDKLVIDEVNNAVIVGGTYGEASSVAILGESGLIEIDSGGAANATLGARFGTTSVRWNLPLSDGVTVGTLFPSTYNNNGVDRAFGAWHTTSGFVFEGSSADDNEGTLAPGNPSADRTWTMPDASGTVAVVTSTPTAHVKQGSVTGVLEDSALVEAGPPPAGTSGNAFSSAVTFNAMDGDDSQAFFRLTPTGADHTGTNNHFSALRIDKPIGDADATEAAIFVDMSAGGFDYMLECNGGPPPSDCVWKSASGESISLESGATVDLDGTAILMDSSASSIALNSFNNITLDGSGSTYEYQFIARGRATPDGQSFYEFGHTPLLMDGNDNNSTMNIEYEVAGGSSGSNNTLYAITFNDGAGSNAFVEQIAMRGLNGMDYMFKFEDTNFNSFLGFTAPTADRTITFPDATGTIPVVSGTPSPAYGELYISTPAATSTTSTTPVKADGTTTLGHAAQFDMPANNRLRYTGTVTTIFECQANTSFISSGTPVTSIFLADNGVVDATTEIARKISTGIDEGAAATGFIVELAQNEHVELWVDTNAGNPTVTFNHMTLRCSKVN